VVKATPTKSRTPFLVVLIALIVAGGGGIWYKLDANKPVPVTLPPGTPLPKAEGYLRGDPNAPITIMEFGDFECPSCGQFATVSEPDIRTRIVDAGLANFKFYDFPLPMHQNTMSASLSASCAADQGKFWEMHDAIFAGQYDWNTQATSNPQKLLNGYAETIGLDMKAFGECVSSQRNLARIQANKKAGEELGVSSTPTIYVGNTKIAGNMSVDNLKKLIDSLRAAAPTPAASATTSDSAKK
jgi:protein-disulfide isomerase